MRVSLHIEEEEAGGDDCGPAPLGEDQGPGASPCLPQSGEGSGKAASAGRVSVGRE